MITVSETRLIDAPAAGLTDAQVAAYRRDGYLVLEQLFAADEVAAMTREADALLAAVRDELRTAGQDPEHALASGVYVGLSARSPFFRFLHADSRLVEPLVSLWSPAVQFLSDKLVYKSEVVEFGSPWHQDYPYWQGSSKISVWIAVDDATETNGCLQVIPGSHAQPIDHDQVHEATGFGNRLDPAKLGLAEPVALPIAAGGAVFFSDLTLHASLPNRDGRPRRAIIETYRHLAEPDLTYDWSVAARRVR